MHDAESESLPPELVYRRRRRPGPRIDRAHDLAYARVREEMEQRELARRASARAKGLNDPPAA